MLPALVLGYDGQGNFYDRNISEYLQKEKGIYMAIGRETLVPGLKLNIGGNMWDFKTNTVCGFASMIFSIEDRFAAIAECDNIHNASQNRVNVGLRFGINESLDVDLAGRDLGAPEGRTAERIIRVIYAGKF